MTPRMRLNKSLNIDISPETRRRQIINEIRSQSEDLKKYNLTDPLQLIREDRKR